jgi:hypothetical protein
MRYLLLILPFFVLLHAIFFLFIGLKVIIKNKPFVINSKWLIAMSLLSMMPLLIDSIISLFKFGFRSPFGLMILIMPLFIITLNAVLFYFVLKGYCIYCVNDIDFRDAVIFSLNNASIKFEEKMNKIELIELNNELSIAFTSWMGTGMIKLKNKKDKIIFMKIIDGIKQFFKEKNLKPPKIVAIFYVILGIFFIILGVSSAIFFYK